MSEPIAFEKSLEILRAEVRQLLLRFADSMPRPLSVLEFKFQNVDEDTRSFTVTIRTNE